MGKITKSDLDELVRLMNDETKMLNIQSKGANIVRAEFYSAARRWMPVLVAVARDSLKST